MLESFIGELTYKRLSPEEMEKRQILGRLVGPIADTKKETRNGRAYSKELWENAINDDIFQEKLNNKCIFAELGHPAADRIEGQEVLMKEACAALAETPKVGKDGKLYGVWDILNTPNGKILKTLCDYGTKIGISSRGEGDVTEDYDGKESVDPDTYSLETFDMVLLPAVKDARLNYVTEALDKKKYNKTLRQRLSEELSKADIDDKTIMEETLNKLEINLEEKLVQPSEEDLKPVEDFLQNDLGFEIEDKGETWTGRVHYQLRKELDHPVAREDLKPIADELYDFTEQSRYTYEIPMTFNMGVHIDGDNIISLAVDVDKKHIDEELKEPETVEENCEDKEEVQDEIKEEVVDNQSNVLNELQETLKDNSSLKASIAEVQNKLAVSDAKVESLEEELQKYKNLASRLGTKAKELKEKSSEVEKLKTDLTESQKTIKSLKVSGLKSTTVLNENISKLKKSAETDRQNLNEQLDTANKEINSLKEELETTKNSLSEKEEELNNKIDKYSKLVESYKKVANSTMRRYIESKATMYGLSFNDIRERLPESYTADDVDKICESMRSYSINMNRLPVGVKPRLRFTESKKDALRVDNLNPADEIDDELIELAKLG